ncbi:hypothetical protein M9H77_35866 [Catharanthus roseus]|uniref:Uncharacterized protein n=1 Tax=Catharanthus roseus TaxID=4058 RepID=A0ACB9ZRH6_CATRO|nr:hypothetical protein M9H77_35866 [Catharanthus roseus]
MEVTVGTTHIGNLSLIKNIKHLHSAKISNGSSGWNFNRELKMLDMKLSRTINFGINSFVTTSFSFNFIEVGQDIYIYIYMQQFYHMFHSWQSKELLPYRLLHCRPVGSKHC